MLDMGFVEDMRFIMKGMAPNRQTLFFSATTTKEIDGLIKEFLNNPERISVKTPPESAISWGHVRLASVILSLTL
jgi:superfamily II DNA/RNA helicase